MPRHCCGTTGWSEIHRQDQLHLKEAHNVNDTPKTGTKNESRE